MLDFRLNTFLTLCQLGSYTKTAEALNITQPAVTQHIQRLEQEFGVPLFQHEKKLLKLTPKGEVLFRFALNVKAEGLKMESILRAPDEENRNITFGATLSIGEYLMPEILTDYLKEHTDAHISMLVENTDTLMNKLQQGIIDFAFIEGNFHKRDYSHKLLLRERFIPVCAPTFSIPKGNLSISQLCNFPVIVRENGSGTRNILENALQEYNLTLKDFKGMHEVGNFTAIKRLVKGNLGITFVFSPVVKQELEEGTLIEIPTDHFTIIREFNFVYLKNSILESKYLEFQQFCMDRM